MGRNVQRLLITGMGKSGTTYIAEIFRKLCLACRHERLFNLRDIWLSFLPRRYVRLLVPWPATIQGGSSWLAAPFSRQSAHRHTDSASDSPSAHRDFVSCCNSFL
jgi:hypothetical protein